MPKFLDDRRYSKSHEWVKVEGDIAYIGVSDYAASELGSLVFVEAEPVDTELEVGDVFGSIESVKMASDLFSPISGKIIEVNSDPEDDPDNITNDAFGAWLVKVEMSDKSQYDELMDAEAYKNFCEVK